MKNRVIAGIRIKFFLAFFISLILGVFTFLLLNGISRNGRTDYGTEIGEFNTRFNAIISEVTVNLHNAKQHQAIISKYGKASLEIFLVDKEGNIIQQPTNSYFENINLTALEKVQSNTNFSGNEIRYSRAQKLDDNTNLVVTGVLIKYDQFKFIFLAMPVFLSSFLFLTYGRIKYIKKLTVSLQTIAGGQLHVKAPVTGHDELSVLAENINQMACELEINKQREREAEKSKDELIANVSHDLRTPLTSVIGYTKLLKEKYTFDEEFDKYMGIIDNKLERLDILINDLFEYTKLNGNIVELTKIEVLFDELVRQVIEELMPLGLQNNVEIIFNSLCENELMVEADPLKMARVFENVIANAIKYSSKPGMVMVRTYVEQNNVIACICNKGSNLGSDEIPRIFDRFYRTDLARNSETGGSGLGLAIAKSIVELHGGQIWAEAAGEEFRIFVSLGCSPF